MFECRAGDGLQIDIMLNGSALPWDIVSHACKLVEKTDDVLAYESFLAPYVNILPPFVWVHANISIAVLVRTVENLGSPSLSRDWTR